jgi:SAM-dependent methyltransferase
MKLSTLIAYRALIDQLSPQDTDLMIRSHVGPLLHAISEHEIQFPELVQQLEKDHQEIHASYSRLISTTRSMKKQLQDLIDDLEAEYFRESERFYNLEIQTDSAEYILNRKANITESAYEYVCSRLKLYSDWHHPAMLFRPGLEPLINNLVGSDPLYLVDHDMELLAPGLARFPPEYQGRLRTYVITEQHDQPILSALPDQQFGLVVAYHYFNFKTLDLIGKYLAEVYTKLRPGGIIAMTFNNCDHAAGVELAERHFMCYTPGSLILNTAKNIGFQLVHQHSLDSAMTWIELQRPGQMTSLRGGQSLARIVAKSK